MMKNADKPAMPVVEVRRVGDVEKSTSEATGLTKREIMAMHIMTGLISGGHLRAADANKMPELAVLMTDKLLAELEKPQ